MVRDHVFVCGCKMNREFAVYGVGVYEMLNAKVQQFIANVF